MSNNGNCDYCDRPRKTKSIDTSKLKGDWTKWPDSRVSLCDDCLRDLRLDKPGNPGLYERRK
ncbi:hypothetical protein M0R72_13720 [Candidatus Pacearchaeota archaeon]|jgi:hypothetical protein|nr:hypothetical protein [Candidatus Pacearchaeota archaeon]